MNTPRHRGAQNMSRGRFGRQWRATSKAYHGARSSAKGSPKG